MSLVSVIVPAYNQACYLGQAIQSALDQTYPELEVIVVDDGSTDDTAGVARGFSDKRVQYVYQENRGLSGARNTGIRRAKGTWLTFLDSDDLFLPEKLSLLIGELANRPDLGLISGQAMPIDQFGNRIGKTFETGLSEDTAQLLLGNPLHVGSVILHRAWQERVGFFDESLRSYEDWDMWLRLARAGCHMRSIAKPVSLYRFHANQMTKDGRQMTSANFATLEKVFRDPDLPDRWRRLHDRAYSLAHLRAAAHAYLVQDYAGAGVSLTKAVELDPSLLTHKAQKLADHFSAWTELPKTDAPLEFLDHIYSHLPETLAALRSRRHINLGRAALKIAFETYERGDFSTAHRMVVRALLHRPLWLFNRGVLSILLKSFYLR